MSLLPRPCLQVIPTTQMKSSAPGRDEQAYIEKMKLGRVLVYLAALLVFGTSLFSSALQIRLGLYDDLALQGLLVVAELTISGILCWALYSGKPWARVLVLFRSSVAIMLIGPDALSIPLVQAMVPNVLFELLWLPLLIAVALLAFGPGVALFFAQESKREREQLQFLKQIETSGDSAPHDPLVRTEIGSVIGLIRTFAEILETSGLEEFYRSEHGSTAQELHQALQAIDAHTSAQLLDRANQLFGSAGPPRDSAKRCDALDALPSSKASALSRTELELDRHGDDLIALLVKHAGGDPQSLGSNQDWSSES